MSSKQTSNFFSSIMVFKSWKQSITIITVIMIITFLILFPLTTYFFPFLLEIDTSGPAILIEIPVIIGILIIGLKIKYKDSLYFTISAVMAIFATVVLILTNVYRFFPDQNLQQSIIVAFLMAEFAILILMFLLQSLIDPIDVLRKNTLKMADGNLVIDKMVFTRYGDEFSQLASAYQTMSENFINIVGTIQESSSKLATASEEVAATAEEVSAVTEEVTSTTNQISRSSTDQSESASKGIDNVNHMSDTVDKALKDIKGTLQVIEEIAGQTNILSLNAAIEAARAGEYGRGFAVVADNVRRLAEDTKKNSSDISLMTNGIINNVGGSVSNISESFQNFAAQSEELSASSEEVAAATEEQSASMVELTRASADLAELAEDLSNISRKFKIVE